MKRKSVSLIILILILNFSFCGCKKEGELSYPIGKPHTCAGEWAYDKVYTCGDVATLIKTCQKCGKILDTKTEKIIHELTTSIQEATCTIDGCRKVVCSKCDYQYEVVIPALGHRASDYIYGTKVGIDEIGTKHKECTICKEVIKTTEYANNGYFAHGKLSVKGPDLVDQYGKKFQLYGLSTHGLQWFHRYVNYQTFENIQDEFGINVIRLALYTSEGGYCNGNQAMKALLFETVKNGIEYATQLGMYVIVDWHMVGAEEVRDKNPLTYMNDSKEFFSLISREYADYDNIIYEIMNEPCGDTTWEDCKKYANEVIPCIRNNNPDAIVLVGNPHWSADLRSVMTSPLTGYNNIMYTYHFYANDHRDPGQVISAYRNNFPVFISEYGFMNSDGNGPLGYEYGENWLSTLDERNISYVAWNISNSSGSASILKANEPVLYDFCDDNLKAWGRLLKSIYRKKAGLLS